MLRDTKRKRMHASYKKTWMEPKFPVSVPINVGHLPYHLLTMYLVTLLALLHIGRAATTVGPFAPISIYSLQAYSTARPCAAGCLHYNGIWHCGFNAGYHDLGSDLGCGCSPLNACWCSSGLQSSATSYISSCVSAACTKMGNIDGDIKSMLDLYGGYCATANVEVSSMPAQTTAATITPAAAISRTTTRSVGSSYPAATQAPSESTTQPDGAKQNEDEGLSKSDVIALATGLGVGIPSLVVAVVALFIQLRKKKPSASGSPIALDTTPAESQTNFFQKPAPDAPEIYELGERGGRRQMWR